MVPTYNRGQFIRECIDSVLSQDEEGVEVIVVDDGSTDNTCEVVSSYCSNKVKYYWQEHKGIPFARNQCLRLASGKYLAFIDSDDLWKPNKLAKQLEFLEKNTDCMVVFSKYTNFFSENVEKMNEYSEKLNKELGMECKNNYALPTALFRRSLLDLVGYFDEKLNIGEDVEWVMRMKFAGISIDNCIEESLYLRRLHKNNSVFTEKPDTKMMAKMLAAQMRKKIMKRLDQ